MRQPKLMCDRCSFEIRLHSCLDCYSLYELPDGGHVPIPIRVEWCYQCKSLCATENLPDIASTSQRVRQARHAVWRCVAGCFSLSRRKRQMGSEIKVFAQKNLDSAERFHRVVSNRKSAPRCLSCGSFDHKELPLSGFPSGKRTILPIQHPGCEGNFVIDDRCPITAEIRGPDRYFTSEGTFLRSVSTF